MPYTGDREDPDALLAAARRERSPLIYFCNPDNPMASWWPASDVKRLIDGVLFLGDSAAGLRNGTLAPNSLLTENAEQNERSLAMLADRLRPRQSDIRQIAFGHQGPLEGLSALLTWAAQRR